MSKFRDTDTLVAEFARHPGAVATVRFDHIVAGMLMRRQVRAALNCARIRGAEVEVHEARGLLESVFAVRLKGTDTQLLPTLRYFAAMEAS